MHAIVTAIVFFKQRTVCIINVWGCADILPTSPAISCLLVHLPILDTVEKALGYKKAI